MPIDSDLAAGALVDTWGHLVSAIQGGWTRAKGGGLAAVTGVALPTVNGRAPWFVGCGSKLRDLGLENLATADRRDAAAAPKLRAPGKQATNVEYRLESSPGALRSCTPDPLYGRSNNILLTLRSNHHM